MIQNIIAMVYDFDLTLSPNYIQQPIFNKFNIKENEFWAEKEKVKKQYEDAGQQVQDETVYLNMLIEKARQGGPMGGLTRQVLKELGDSTELFPGLPEFFNEIKKIIEEDEKYKQREIKIEHYIASTGLLEMLRGSKIAKYMTFIEGCEFFYDGQERPTGILRVMSHTEKTAALFRINKGVYTKGGPDVNSSIDDNVRRIPFRNILYFGDGPSDVPAMSVTKKYGGHTFAVYNPNTKNPNFKRNPAENALNLKESGRADHCFSADYRKESDLHTIVLATLRKIADRIVDEADFLKKHGVISPPAHKSDW